MIHKGRGRPRHFRIVLDKGTKELQQKRQKLLCRNNSSTPFLAESLLGIFYGRELVSRAQYEGGCAFEELGHRYALCLDPAFRHRACGLALKFQKGTSSYDVLLSEHQEEKRTREWRRAVNVLQKAGLFAYDIVFKVVFYDQDLYASEIPSPGGQGLDALRRGLDYLDLYFKGEFSDKQHILRGLAENPGKSTRFPQPLGKCPPAVLP